MIIPKDIEENKKARLKLLAVKNNEDKAVILRKCKEDTVFFIDMFCWTYNPRLTNPHIPFILYPRQEALINKLDEYLIRSQTISEKYPTGEPINLIIDKPRDVGATFTLMVWFLHKFLFSEFSGRVGSRKEDYVDKRGDSDTLFYKLDYNIEKLPKWMTGGFNQNFRNSMIIKHPTNTNVISGESANPNFGRGGRKSAIVFDEIGFWETAQSSWESAGASTNLRIAMSTPPEIGRSSFFYKLVNGQKGKIEKFDFDWQDVPTRDKNWLITQKESKSEEEFMREVMKSFDGSTEGKVYANDMRKVKISEVDYNPKLPLFVSWDDGLDGTALIWWQKDFATDRLFIIDCYQNKDKDIEYFVPFFGRPIPSRYSVIDGSEREAMEYDSYAMEKIELHNKWRKDIIHYGDPSIKQRKNNIGMSSFYILQQKHGIIVNSHSWNSMEFGKRKWKDIRDITRTKFRKIEINGKRCEMLIYSLRNARYPKVNENSNATSISLQPIHDSVTSHLRSSFEYFCDNEPEDYFMYDREEVEEGFNKFDIF